MTPERPDYENYPPPTADTDPVTHTDSSNGPAAPTGWVLTPAPIQPPGGPGPSRRLLLGGVVGLGLLAAPIIWGVGRAPDDGDPGPDESFAVDPDDQGDTTESHDLDGLDVEVPDGWREVSSTDHRLVIRQGINTVTFLHYAAGQDASAMDEARQQLRRYAADVRSSKELGADTSTTEDGLEKAEVALTGQVDGEPVDVVSTAVIDVGNDYDAVAVVSVLARKAATGVASQVKRMRQDLIDQLG